MPSCYKGIQTAMLKILSIDESCYADLCISLLNKCTVTFCLEVCGIIDSQVDWFLEFEELFKGVISFLRICWLKAIGGAWTATTECMSLLNGPACLVAQIVRMKSDAILFALFCGYLRERHFVCLKNIFRLGTGCA